MADITQRQLAAKLGWDQKTVSNIESGAKRVTALELIELAEAIGFDAAAVIRRIAAVPPAEADSLPVEPPAATPSKRPRRRTVPKLKS
jgi:transcriptional regulator with XRE-family HTH domain